MIREIDRYYYEIDEPARSCLLALRSIILEQDPEVVETRKWSSPCFTFRKRMFCFLSTYKKSGDPYLLFVEGIRLTHPSLEAGNRKRMKILRVDPEKDLPLRTIQSILKDALDLYRNGVIKTITI